MARLTRTWLLAALAALALSACVGGTASVYPGQEFAPTDPAQVQVYRFFPDVPAVRVGEVEVYGATGTSPGNFYDELRRKAASIGGQAVVIVGQRDQLLSVYETPSQFQALPGAGLGRQAFFFPGQVYPQSETNILGIVLRFPKGGPVPPGPAPGITPQFPAPNPPPSATPTGPRPPGAPQTWP